MFPHSLFIFETKHFFLSRNNIIITVTVTCCHHWSAGLTPFQDYHVDTQHKIQQRSRLRSLSSRTINSCGDKPYHGHQPKPYQQSPPSQQQPTVLYSENQVRIAGGSCDALFICSKGTTQSPRLRARCKTESSEESVSSWKNHENTNQQQRRYTGRNCRDTLVVFDFKYFFRGIDCGCDGNNAKVEFPFLSEEVCGIEGAVRTSRKSWTSCAQNAAATRIEAWSVEADFLVSEELYCRVDALQEDHGVRGEMRDGRLSRLSRKLLRDHNPCASPDKRRADGSSGFPECEDG
ncbi:hypothetical protein T4D_2627 [Trichinella pseudospiralis]|uniref:Uncharacterized protein n=1 Tax=Trichinella pseudospiralis TaxID=6337 RepID=A0A0V1G0K9_TRIPS|nr:hypothetical protein T4D_2627 [Trichinella pseudospiralis]